ncbi:hypothetical protein RUND412_007161 [Rhizina undulata]
MDSSEIIYGDRDEYQRGSCSLCPCSAFFRKTPDRVGLTDDQCFHCEHIAGAHNFRLKRRKIDLTPPKEAAKKVARRLIFPEDFVKNRKKAFSLPEEEIHSTCRRSRRLSQKQLEDEEAKPSPAETPAKTPEIPSSPPDLYIGENNSNFSVLKPNPKPPKPLSGKITLTSFYDYFVARSDYQEQLIERVYSRIETQSTEARTALRNMYVELSACLMRIQELKREVEQFKTTWSFQNGNGQNKKREGSRTGGNDITVPRKGDKVTPPTRNNSQNTSSNSFISPRIAKNLSEDRSPTKLSYSSIENTSSTPHYADINPGKSIRFQKKVSFDVEDDEAVDVDRVEQKDLDNLGSSHEEGGAGK